jgi:hypothetical protein
MNRTISDVIGSFRFWFSSALGALAASVAFTKLCVSVAVETALDHTLKSR